MQSNLVKSALAGAALLACASAHSDDRGWYASAVFGANLLGDQDAQYQSGTASGSAERSFDTSIAAGGTFGYEFGNQWRGELELMYRRNEQSDPVTIDGLGSFDDGDFASLAITASALFDFNWFSDPNITTYVGAGIAFIQEIDIDFETAGTETSFETDDIGLQLQAGARYRLGERWFVDAGVRYLIASDVELELPADSSQTVTSDYDPLTLSVAVGWRF